MKTFTPGFIRAGVARRFPREVKPLPGWTAHTLSIYDAWKKLEHATMIESCRG